MSNEITVYEIRIDHPQGFGGHEFGYESDTDLFKCEICGRYEVTVRDDETGEIAPCAGKLVTEETAEADTKAVDQ